jgi:transposase InsO family protein
MELRILYSTFLLCAIANVSRSGFYKWLNTKQIKREDDILDILKFEHRRLNGIYGYRKMKVLLKKKYDITINHKKLKKIMKENALNACIRLRKYRNAEKENKTKLVAENVLARDFRSEKPGEKYITDITYIPIPLIDLFNGEVVERKTSTNLDASLSVDVIKKLSKKRDLNGAIIHSDQGMHYTNNLYNELLKEKGVIQSMSRRGNCWDNAVMENFFSHFKSECVKIRKRAMKTSQDVKEIVDEYIYFYNNERIQLKLNGLAPVEFRSQLK